jgi:hypothetical protein
MSSFRGRGTELHQNGAAGPCAFEHLDRPVEHEPLAAVRLERRLDLLEELEAFRRPASS